MSKHKDLLYILLILCITSTKNVYSHKNNILLLSSIPSPQEDFGNIKAINPVPNLDNLQSQSRVSLVSHPSIDDEFVGPFPSWLNLKSQFGAVGNGITDDTKAIQKALDSIGQTNSASKVLYIPAGTYIITQTLNLKSKEHLSIIGADPATTIIRWNGKRSDPMFNIIGVWYSRFNRIQWDGNGLAGIAINQTRNNLDAGSHFDTGNEYADNIFANVEFGIKGGFSNGIISFAETAIMRCKFIRNSKAGICIGNYNALDIWIWHCTFQDCNIGVTNTFGGAGGFRVYNSVFRNSIVSDIVIGDVVEFAFRDNTSTNSQAFIIAGYNPNPIPMTIQGNTIIDPISNAPITIYQQGPIALIDNIFRSRTNSIGPVVVCNAPNNDADFFAIGNVFTVTNPIKADKSVIYKNSIVSRDSLLNLKEQPLPGVQTNLNRLIYEVPVGANSEVIQKIIDAASKRDKQRSVVHLPQGIYYITSTLTIPIGSDIQLVGDSYSSLLQWAGLNQGPVIRILGPSKATLRDLSISGNNKVDGILVTNVDQVNARVFMHQLESHNNQEGLFVNRLDNTTVLMYNSGFTISSVDGINVVGGPLARIGKPQQGRTIMYAGCDFDNSLSHRVTNGGNLLIRDVWYESSQANQYLDLSGSGVFTVDASRIANTHTMIYPQIKISNFSGKATFLNSYLTDRIAITGNGSQAKILGLGVHSDSSKYFYDSSSPRATIRSVNSRTTDYSHEISGSGSYSVDDIGPVDETFIASMIESARNIHTQVLVPLGDNVTDLRFYRVWTGACRKAVELQGNDTSSLFFRSKNSGYFDNINTWESSLDSINWVNTTIIPNANSSSISIRTGHTVTIPDSCIIDQLSIMSGGTLEIAPNASLIINDGVGDDIFIASLGSLIIKSDSTGTGRIGNSSGTISGNVTVERYLNSTENKLYRLLSPSVNTATGPKPFIRDNWQEGQNNTSMKTNNNLIPHRGIHITGSTIGTNGFDITSKGTGSLFNYNPTSVEPSWLQASNTNATTLEAKKGYLVLISGDRSTDLKANNAPSSTTIRATGTILSGMQTFTKPEGDRGTILIGNPYPSPINWSTIYNDLSTTNFDNFENYYTYWDTRVGATGGYVTVNSSGIKSAPTNATTEIQTGQAFLIKVKKGIASPIFTIKESNKSSTSNLSVFRVNSPQQFMSTLYFTTNKGVRVMADAVNTVFNDDFSNTVDNDDAEEMANKEENIAINREGQMLSIEQRSLINARDKLPLNIERLKTQNYEWQFDPLNFTQLNLQAYLDDKFLNTRTPVSLTTTTSIQFAVDMNPSSFATDRFQILFSPKKEIWASSVRSVKAYQKTGFIQIDWEMENETDVDKYEIEKSYNSVDFKNIGLIYVKEKTSAIKTLNWLDITPYKESNFYRVKIIDQSGSSKFSSIVNVKMNNGKSDFDIYPNPIIGDHSIIKFNNVPQGFYTITLLSNTGQTIIQKTVYHNGGSGSQNFPIDSKIPSGNYILQISGNGRLFSKNLQKK